MSLSRTPASSSVSAIAIAEPPFQTPHSTNAPGMSCFTTYSTAAASPTTRSGVDMVYGLTRSQSATRFALKSGGYGDTYLTIS